MGDILHALPAATALRNAHPEWTIGWAIEPRWQALLRATSEGAACSDSMPLVDKIHLVNAKRWARRPLHPSTLGEIRKARREIREAGYDICVDLQGAVRSAIIGRWARAARMLGEDKPREPAARGFFREKIATSGVHVIEQAAEVLAGIAGEDLLLTKPLLPRDARACLWVDTLLGNRVSAPFAIVNPGAGWGAKRWPAQRYAEVAKGLAGRGYGVVVNAGPDELELADEVAGATGGAALPVTPTLGQLIELTRRCSVLIAGDTGPLHLACALGKPVVGIFGPTDPARNGPFGCEFRVLRHPQSRRDHSRHAHPEAGLLTISPEAVIEAAAALLKEQPIRGQ